MGNRLLWNLKCITYLGEHRLFGTLRTDLVPVHWRRNLLAIILACKGLLSRVVRISELAYPPVS